MSESPARVLARELVAILRQEQAARHAIQERDEYQAHVGGRYAPDLSRALDKSLPLEERQRALEEALGESHTHPGRGWHKHRGPRYHTHP